MSAYWRLAAFMLLFFLTSACRQRIPGISMPENKLVAVLLDVHTAEAALQNVHGKSKDSLTQVYLDQVCEIHKITREDLERVMEELRNNPAAMDQAYRKAIKLQEERNAK